MRKTELLIPAGSLDVLKTAVIYGADAVYIGGEAFGLRAKAHNFSLEDMKEGIAFAHAHAGTHRTCRLTSACACGTLTAVEAARALTAVRGTFEPAEVRLKAVESVEAVVLIVLIHH